MSRTDGFPVADTDTSLPSDPKVVALARRLHDSIRTGAAQSLYEDVRLASWKAGRRLTLDESLPGWWLDPFDDLADALVAVGLLDDERRLPAHAFEGWYGPARDRRQRYRDLGSKGGQTSHTPKPTVERTVERTVVPPVERTVNPVRSSRPFLPTVPTGELVGEEAGIGQDGTWPAADSGPASQEALEAQERRRRWNEAHPKDQVGVLP
jgi:hypothetical protein